KGVGGKGGLCRAARRPQWPSGTPASEGMSWRSVIALDQLRGSFGQPPRLDAEMNCSENFTPRLQLWSTVRRDVLNIEFSNQWTRRRSKLCSGPSGEISTLSRRRLATGGSNHICRRAIPYL